MTDYTDEDVPRAVQKVLAENEQAVEGFKNGKERALDFLATEIHNESYGNISHTQAYRYIYEVEGEFGSNQE